MGINKSDSFASIMQSEYAFHSSTQEIQDANEMDAESSSCGWTGSAGQRHGLRADGCGVERLRSFHRNHHGQQHDSESIERGWRAAGGAAHLSPVVWL